MSEATKDPAPRIAKIGDVVIWHDARGKPFNALVQCVWSPECINVVIISGDENKKDTYGRQIEHMTSCTHLNPSSAHGFYWRWPDEPAKPYEEPQAS